MIDRLLIFNDSTGIRYFCLLNKLQYFISINLTILLNALEESISMQPFSMLQIHKISSPYTFYFSINTSLTEDHRYSQKKNDLEVICL